VAEFITNLSNGIYNELPVQQLHHERLPHGAGEVPAADGPRRAAIGRRRGLGEPVVGTDGPSQGNSLDQHTVEITDNFTIPVGSHSITLGTKNVFYSAVNLFASNAYGVWEFASLDSLNNGRGQPLRDRHAGADRSDQGIARVKARKQQLLRQDAWAVTPRLTVTGGVAWDKPTFKTAPPLNEIVLTEYGRRRTCCPRTDSSRRGSA
jgi:hypothetical protein